MRISELSKQAGVPVATIKYYLREGLLPPGERTKVNQAQYGDEHLTRLVFIRGVMAVGRASIATIRDMLAVADTSPEDYCWRCGGPNVPWSAPSPLWNEVMRGGDINAGDLHGGIICPTCFAVLVQAAGVAELWKLYADRVLVPLATVTPSGRTWNAETWRWDEPATSAAVVVGTDAETACRSAQCPACAHWRGLYDKGDDLEPSCETCDNTGKAALIHVEPIAPAVVVGAGQTDGDGS